MHKYLITSQLHGGPLYQMKGNYLSTLPDGKLITLTFKPECVPPVKHFHSIVLQLSSKTLALFKDLCMHRTMLA